MPGRATALVAATAVVLALLAGAGAPARVAAAPSATSEAEAFVRRGTALLEKRDYKGALLYFREAYDVAPSPPIVARIGLAEQGLGRWTEAEFHLVEALAARTDTWVNQRRAILEKALADVRTRIGSLTIAGTPRGARVQVDGETKGVLPLSPPVRLVVGEKNIDVVADGHRAFHATVRIEPGRTTELGVVLEEVPDLGGSPARLALGGGAAGASYGRGRGRAPAAAGSARWSQNEAAFRESQRDGARIPAGASRGAGAEGDADAGADAQTRGGTSSWVAWTLAATGAALSGGGAYLLFGTGRHRSLERVTAGTAAFAGGLGLAAAALAAIASEPADDLTTHAPERAPEHALARVRGNVHTRGRVFAISLGRRF